ncbi:unnamed protein product [Rotaria magnacalcarata]|uniref:Uncharacterized protein n=1 Tax=Rotaria magnacalcarata TaxID=392030 RepID=A0A816XVZ2_9BILA|nr:unnamed protein product [Rotaria magnacalcarata]
MEHTKHDSTRNPYYPTKSRSTTYNTVISTIHLFTITTTSDKSISDIPKSIPALIQIQAIRDEELSVLILVEVQHHPHRSTPLFQQIQQLCHTIFFST